MATGKKYDITALGECLIDFVQTDPNDGGLSFAGNPGGAPANLLAAASRLGLRCAFIGKVGSDVFGRQLMERYAGAGIDVGAMRVSPDRPTTLAFVSLDRNGDRDFSFYRNGTADCMLERDEVDAELIRSSRVFHFGSISMTAEPCREATRFAVDTARESGALISFDPNYRPLLWPDSESARRAIVYGSSTADIVKVSEQELPLLSGRSDMVSAAREVIDRYGPRLLVVTLGRDGAFCVTRSGLCLSAPALEVDTVDTTGAGDAFFGAFLAGLLGVGGDPDTLTSDELEHILRMGTAGGSLSTARFGALPAMPSRDELLAALAGM